MSILIKGMKMPSCCMFCPLSNSCGCGLTNPPVLMTSKEMLADRPDWCPLVPVPHHGRLIDADALMLEIQEYIEEYGWETDEHGWHNEKWCAMKEAEAAIEDAPTIIPEEPCKEKGE